MHKILEPELKLMVINYLLENGTFTENDTVINEFTIDKYSRRVDLALVKTNRLFAYEIKSNSDSLTRLNGQVTKYLEYFDKVTVITAPKHTLKALNSTPANVAIWEVDIDTIKVIRRGRSILITDKYKFLQLMTATELAKLARQHKLSVSLQRRKVFEQNLIYLPISTIRKYTLNFLRERYKKNNVRFFESLKNSRLSNTKDLKLLRSEHTNEIKSKQFTAVNSLISTLDLLKDEIEKKS